MIASLRTPVRKLVELLVARRYEDIAQITTGKRLDAESIERAISEYGRTLVLPPETAFDILDVVPVNNSQPPQWSIRMNLWTAEEGKSDLSIELTLSQRGDGYHIELDDIHVL